MVTYCVTQRALLMLSRHFSVEIFPELDKEDNVGDLSTVRFKMALPGKRLVALCIVSCQTYPFPVPGLWTLSPMELPDPQHGTQMCAHNPRECKSVFGLNFIFFFNPLFNPA